MKAHEVMTWGVITVEPDASVTRAVRLMLQNKISGLPVVEAEGQLVGMVTEGDFLRRGQLGTQRQRPRWLEFLLGPGKLATEYVQASGQKVKQIMTPEPKTVTPQTPLEEVVGLMERHRIKRLRLYRTASSSASSAGLISCMRWRASRARSSRRPATMPLSANRSWPNVPSSHGRRASMWWCAMAWSVFGA
jgi:CBS domain-containing protein